MKIFRRETANAAANYSGEKRRCRIKPLQGKNTGKGAEISLSGNLQNKNRGAMFALPIEGKAVKGIDFTAKNLLKR